jgi:hypothetical protein
MARIGPWRAAGSRRLWTDSYCAQPLRHAEVCYGPSCGVAFAGHLRCDIVDGHRYADDDEPNWYSGKSQYDADASGAHAVGNPYDSGIHERPSGSFRLPEQRPADAAGGYAVTDPLIATGGHAARPAEYDARTSVRGPQYPTIKPPAERETPLETVPVPPGMVPPAAPPGMVPPPASPAAPPEMAPPMAEPTSLVPPVIRPPQPETVYHTRRPVSSVLVAIVMIVLMIPVIRLLIDATFSGDPTSRAIVPAVLLTLGFTLTGIGLFTIARGGPLSRESWLRPPVAYLPAGLILLLAAGLAVA